MMSKIAQMAVFLQTFDTPASAKAFAGAYPDLATRFRFGTQKDPGELWPNGQAVTKAQAASSRTFPGILNVQADPGFDPQAISPKVMNGLLYLDVYRHPYSADKPFYGAMVSPKEPFLYGRFAVEALIPRVSGTWPAVYLYEYNATTKAEIDFMEHFGGPVTVQSGGKPVVIDRVGKPVSTVHFNGTAYSNTRNLPSIGPGFHTFGGVWTPDYISAEIDGHEVFRTPNPGIHAPMYLIVTLDVSETAGSVTAGKFPAYMAVRSIRVEGCG